MVTLKQKQAFPRILLGWKLRFNHFMCRPAVLIYKMYYDGEKIVLQQWDMPTVKEQGGLHAYLSAMEDHLAATQVPFVPTVYQLTDLIISGGRRSTKGHWHAVSKLYKISNSVDENYSIIELPEPDGGSRTIYVPSPSLKSLQDQIYKKIIFTIPVSQYAVAYIPGMNLKDGAARHVGHPVLLKLDIHLFLTALPFPWSCHMFSTQNGFSKGLG